MTEEKKRSRNTFEDTDEKITTIIVQNTFIISQLDSLPVDPTTFEDNIGCEVNSQKGFFKQVAKFLNSDPNLRTKFRKLQLERNSLIKRGTKLIIGLRDIVTEIESRVEQSDAEYNGESNEEPSSSDDDVKPLDKEDIEEIVPKTDSENDSGNEKMK